MTVCTPSYVFPPHGRAGARHTQQMRQLYATHNNELPNLAQHSRQHGHISPHTSPQSRTTHKVRGCNVFNTEWAGSMAAPGSTCKLGTGSTRPRLKPTTLRLTAAPLHVFTVTKWRPLLADGCFDYNVYNWPTFERCGPPRLEPATSRSIAALPCTCRPSVCSLRGSHFEPLARRWLSPRLARSPEP